MTRRLLTLAVFCWLTGGASASLAAHEGHDHKILGTVTMAASDRLMLKDREGEEVTVLVTKDTKVRPAMKVEAITPGSRVVVTASMEKDKRWTAKMIEVGSASSK